MREWLPPVAAGLGVLTLVCLLTAAALAQQPAPPPATPPPALTIPAPDPPRNPADPADVQLHSEALAWLRAEMEAVRRDTGGQAGGGISSCRLLLAAARAARSANPYIRDEGVKWGRVAETAMAQAAARRREQQQKQNVERPA